jgi:hypothetical protein
MKKLTLNNYVWGIFFVIFLSINPFSVYAISGTCSHHGGVNCVQGIDETDGSVICNDSWKESGSIYEYQTQCTRCENFDGYTKSRIVQKLQMDIIDLSKDLDTISNQLTEKLGGRGLVGMSRIQDTYRQSYEYSYTLGCDRLMNVSREIKNLEKKCKKSLGKYSLLQLDSSQYTPLTIDAYTSSNTNSDPEKLLTCTCKNKYSLKNGKCVKIQVTDSPL